MSVKKKTCRICAREDLHANFVNIFELTVTNVNGGDAGDDKISLFETMRQLTGIKVILFIYIVYSCCSMRVRTYQIRTTPDKKKEKNIWMLLLFGVRLNCFEKFKTNKKDNSNSLISFAGSVRRRHFEQGVHSVPQENPIRVPNSCSSDRCREPSERYSRQRCQQ